MKKEKKYPQIDPNLPIKRVWFIFYFVIIMVSVIVKLRFHAKVKKVGKLPKPPYILISNHSSMIDFYQALALTFPHRPYWISTVEEFVPRFFIFRRIGVLAKRKFTNDPVGAMRYLEVLKKKKILIFYPEARYTFDGEPERIDKSIGRFVKTANVPVVFLKTHGHYLYCPQWSDFKPRHVKHIYAEGKCIIHKYELETMTAEDIQLRIENQYLNISEEQWQRKNNIINSYPARAVGLEHILYKCPHCGIEFEMSTSGHQIKCNHCGETYDYLENGQLKNINGKTIFDYPSKWYKWEKEECKKEVINGTYHFSDEVRVEKLLGAKIGFVPLKGNYKLEHDINNGYLLKGTDNDFEFIRSPLQNLAIHIDFHYLDRGPFVELSDLKDTYFIYPLTNPLALTKIHFANEIIYDIKKAELKKE